MKSMVVLSRERGCSSDPYHAKLLVLVSFCLLSNQFTSKQLNKQALKTKNEMEKDKKRVKKEIQLGNNDIARLYAQSAIRKQTERMNLLQLAARIDTVASRVQTAVTMRQVTGNMATVVKGMDVAMAKMNPEQISLVMDKFESQFEDLDATASYYENATVGASAVSVPQDEVDVLMQSIADEAGLELQHEMDANTPQRTELTSTEQVEDNLNERLRALRS